MSDDLDLVLAALIASLCDWMLSLGAPVGLVVGTLLLGFVGGLLLVVDRRVPP